MKTLQKLLLIGGGGHAKACIDVIEQEGKYNIFGVIDGAAFENGVKNVLDYPILGGDELLPTLIAQCPNALITIGQIQSPAARIGIYQTLKNLGYNLPFIISPLAYVARSAKISEGSIIMHHALINANATIGKACIINSKALIEHDCVVGDFCHLSTSSIINGSCHIGEGSFLGSNMILRHSTHIAPHSVLYHNPLERVYQAKSASESILESAPTSPLESPLESLREADATPSPISPLLAGGGAVAKTSSLLCRNSPLFARIHHSTQLIFDVRSAS